MQLALERARADHVAAEASTREAAAAQCQQLTTQLDAAQREAAVKQALCEGWQRANQVCRAISTTANPHVPQCLCADMSCRRLLMLPSMPTCHVACDKNCIGAVHQWLVTQLAVVLVHMLWRLAVSPTALA